MSHFYILCSAPKVRGYPFYCFSIYSHKCLFHQQFCMSASVLICLSADKDGSRISASFCLTSWQTHCFKKLRCGKALSESRLVWKKMCWRFQCACKLTWLQLVLGACSKHKSVILEDSFQLNISQLTTFQINCLSPDLLHRYNLCLKPTSVIRHSASDASNIMSNPFCIPAQKCVRYLIGAY